MFSCGSQRSAFYFTPKMPMEYYFTFLWSSYDAQRHIRAHNSGLTEGILNNHLLVYFSTVPISCFTLAWGNALWHSV